MGLQTMTGACRAISTVVGGSGNGAGDHSARSSSLMLLPHLSEDPWLQPKLPFPAWGSPVRRSPCGAVPMPPEETPADRGWCCGLLGLSSCCLVCGVGSGEEWRLEGGLAALPSPGLWSEGLAVIEGVTSAASAWATSGPS